MTICRHRYVDRHVAVLRRLVRQNPGLNHSYKQRPTQPEPVVHEEGANRRLRNYHSVELPLNDGLLENGRLSRGRQYCCTETGAGMPYQSTESFFTQ